MMLILYRLIFLPGLILGLPYYAWRMWKRGGYREGFSNRFGLMSNVPPKCKNVKRIWIQAVSVGELLAIQPLLRQLQEDPGIEVVLTTTTSTGLRVLRDRLASLVIWNGVFPLDFWPCSNHAWNEIEPDLALLMEGELWPEHIHQARKRNVPVMLVNARLSDKSFSRHLQVKDIARHFFRHLDAILAGSETDRNRFQQLEWIDTGKISLMGNLKLDVDLPETVSASERMEALSEFGMPMDNALLVLGSSTWPGEENALVDAFLELKANFPLLRLLIVPRHAERKNEIIEILRSKPVACHFRSEGRNAPEGTEVYVADTTGELSWLSRFADVVFVGKSLPPNEGGQTPVEAAALGKPLIFGSDMSNFRDISRQLLTSGAAIRVSSPGELKTAIEKLLQSEDTRLQMGSCASNCIESSRGATERLIDKIRFILFQDS